MNDLNLAHTLSALIGGAFSVGAVIISFALITKRDNKIRSEDLKIERKLREEAEEKARKERSVERVVRYRPYLIYMENMQPDSFGATRRFAGFREDNPLVFFKQFEENQTRVKLLLTNVGVGPALHVNIDNVRYKECPYIIGGFDNRSIDTEYSVGCKTYYSSALNIPAGKTAEFSIDLKYNPKILKLNSGLLTADIVYFDLLDNEIVFPFSFGITDAYVHYSEDTKYVDEEINKAINDIEL